MNIPFEISQSSTSALAVDPYILRPGTVVDLKYKYVRSLTTTWDTSTTLSVSIPNNGYVSPYSARIPGYNIPWNYVVVDNDNHIFTLMPIDKGTKTVYIHYWTWETEAITAVSAMNSSGYTYYKDFIVDSRGYVIPKTIIPLPANAISSAETGTMSLADYLVTANIYVAGITRYQGNDITATSCGTITGVVDTNLFRVGIEEITVPTDIVNYYDRDLKWVVGPKKNALNVITGLRILIDNQEWDGSAKDIKGVVTIGRYFYVMTNCGLYQFLHDTYFDYSEKDWPQILGNDITYDDEGNLCVASFKNNLPCIIKYKIETGLVFVDPNSKTLYKREKDTIVSFT